MKNRVVISNVTPSVDAGRYAAKAVVGDDVIVGADLLREGHDLLAAVEEVYADLEATWAGAAGRAEVEQVRSVLVAVLTARHGGALPPVRPTW